MIPILFEKTDTDFTTHGLCRLSDALSTEAYTEGNGQREFTLEYPVTGENYDEILIERIIGAYADDTKRIQGYRIYAITKPINGIVTIYAHHVSYDLSGKVVTVPSGSYTPSSLMALLFSGTNFTGWSDIADSKTVAFNVPTSVASILGGVEGSILDTFGGEYEFDNFTVKLHAQKGADNGVVVEYGKNITNIVDEYNTDGVFTSIVPYATYTDSSGLEQTVVGDKITFNSVLTVEKTAAIDFSDRFDYDNIPTKAALATLGNAYIANNDPGNTVSNMTLSFVPLWYDGSDDSVGLYDTITARHTKLGVDKKVKVVAVWYDCLAERISRMTCGRLSSNFVSTVVDLQSQEAKTAKEITVFPDRWKQAVEAATRAITGNDGGYVVLHIGASGKPYEMLILDNPDIEQAQNVWRWTLGGLGFSSNGYDGPYELAITADGNIIADFIRAGKIQDAAGNNSWNLNTGYFKLMNGELNITYKKTYNHEDYDATDVSTVQNYINGVITSLTDAQWEKYDFIGDRDITNWNKTRIEQMIALQKDTVKTVVTLVSSSVDPNNGMSSSIYVPALGTSSGKGVTGTMSGASLYSNYISGKKIRALRQLLVDSGGTKTISIDDTNITLKDATYTKTITASGPTPTSGYAQVSVPTGTAYHTVTQFDLDPGTYLIQVHFHFPNNTSGRRVGIVSYSQDSGTQISQAFVGTAAPVNGANTTINICGTVKPNSTTTFYLNAMQNSGSALNTFASWSYVRLA